MYKNLGGLSLLLLFLLIACSGRQAASSQDELIGTAEQEIFQPSGYPIVQEPITISALANKRSLNGDFNTMPTIQRLAEKSGIRMDISGVPESNYVERLNLLLASNNLPDAVLADVAGIDLMRYAGEVVRPIEGYMDAYMPNLRALLEKRPVLRKYGIRSDGHTYSLPRVEELPQRATPNNLFINQTWLDSLGLAMPTTTEELYQVLKAFKERDPNGNGLADEIPFSAQGNGWWPWRGLYTFSGSFFFPMDDTLLRINRDRLEFVPLAEAEGFQQFVLWYQRLYGEGLLDLETYTQSQAEFYAKGKTEPETLGAFVAWFDEEVVGNARTQDYRLVLPLRGPEGRQQLLHAVREFSGAVDVFLLSAKNPYPASTMRLMDLAYEPEFAWQIVHGPWDIVLTRDAEGMVRNLPPPEGLTVDEWRFQNAPAVNFPYALLEEDLAQYLGPLPIQRKEERHRELAPYLAPAEEYVPILHFTTEEDTELSVLRTDIMDFFQQTFVRWVTAGGDPTAGWEDFAGQLERIGVARYVEIYQAAYERFRSS